MMGRVEVEGRHLRLDGERFVVRGTAYGRFAPRTDGARYPEPPVVRADLESIATTGLNTIRTCDVPPADVLHAAAEVGLRVFVGLDYPDWRFEPFPDRSSGRRIAAAGLAAVDRLFERVDDPAVILAVSVGRTVPADLVRVHHPGAVANTLSSIIDRIHTLDPLVPATYTGRTGGDELLTVDGCDLLSVVLDTECGQTFERDLIRLQQTRPAKPLVVTDLRPPTVGATATVTTFPRDLTDRLNALDRAGCAGATVGTWRGLSAVGESADTSADSLLTPNGAPRPICRSVETWARQDVKDLRRSWPRVTALVSCHNSEATIERCLSALEMSDYHDLEVIVCDEGSTDRSAALAARYPFELLRPGRPGGSGRAAGVEAASGDVIAFIDADVVCDSLWPWFVALAFDATDQVAVVTDHLIEVDDDGGAVAKAMARLADVGRAPSADPSAAVAAGYGSLAVRRSALRSGDGLPSGSASAVDMQLLRRLADQSTGGVIGTVTAAQASCPAPDSLGTVWKDAAGRGRADREASQRYPTGNDRPRRVIAELLSAVAAGERPRRSVAVLALLDSLVPLLAAAVALGGFLAVSGVVATGLLLAATSIVTVAALAAVVAHDAAVADRRSASARIGLAVAVIVILQPLARTWGYLRAGTRPPAPAKRAWTGDREAWLSELRWRLGLEGLSVFAPPNRSRWDVEARCGLFLRTLIVTAVAWQWTPHVRTALRPRWLIVTPVAAATLIWSLSPMSAALIASATIGELAFELITLRRVDGVISRSITGSLPPVRSAIEPTTGGPEVETEIELAARSTLDL